MFQDYIVYSTVLNTTSKRSRAGVSVLIKNKHLDFVSNITSASPNIIWSCLKGHLFGIHSDISLAAVYLPPLQSQRKAGEDVLSVLEQEIHKFSTGTGTLNDFIENDCQDFTAADTAYNLDKNWPKRNNANCSFNKLGDETLRLCIGNKPRLLNGRVTGDLDGKLTSYQYNGASTVDYGIVSEDLQNVVLGFQVQALTPYSDHCPITLQLACRNRDIMYNNNTPKRVSKNRGIFAILLHQVSLEARIQRWIHKYIVGF